MKLKLILRLALVLSVLILRPDPAGAEDRIWVDGNINGQPVRLAFDTGATGPLLFKKSAERLGLKVAMPTNTTPPSPDRVMVGETEVCEFDLMGKLVKMQFGVFDLPTFVASEIDGILGWGALADDIILIDAGQGNVVAIGKLPAEVKAWQSFRLQTNAEILTLEIPGSEKTNTIVVDTGSQGGIALAPKKWQAWKKTHPKQRLTVTGKYNPAAGVVVKEEAWADKISFGPLLLTDVPISEAHSAERIQSCEGVFGLAALKRLLLVVDMEKGIAYVQASKQAPIPYNHNRLGAAFIPNNPLKNDDLVAHVADGSPAQKAGIQDGDVLLKVNDMDMTKWRTGRSPLPSRFWEQPKGTEYRLLLRRGQRTNEVNVKLENILGPGKL